ncbi:MAG: metallophosphoesterase family protein [Acidobacteriota bacterium]
MRHILHVSDIHFGPHFRPDVAAGVSALIEHRRPDLVVISGDLTQRAKIRQFQDARRWVDAFPVPWIAVPGNHDVPMYRAWERVLAPYGVYRRHFADEMEPIFVDDEIYVLGVNTAFNWTIRDGRYSRAGLRRLLGELEAAPADRAKIVVAHHHLIPPPRFDTQRVTERAREAIEILVHFEVEMVLSGHLHQTWIGTTEQYYPSGRRPVLLVHSGTTTSGRGRGCERRRNTCNWIEIHDGHHLVRHLIWQPDAERFDEQSRHVFPRGGPGWSLGAFDPEAAGAVVAGPAPADALDRR